MSAGNTGTVKKAEVFASSLLELYLSDEMVFHSLEHTRQVVKAVKEISMVLEISAMDREIILVAAWFHDVGYASVYEGHELYSQRTARSFLEAENWPHEKIQKVLHCIKATEMPQQPHNLMEEILCDADMFHLATSDYFDRLARLRKEWEWYYGKKEKDRDWVLRNIDFLITHEYFTSYGREILAPQKEQKINLLQKML